MAAESVKVPPEVVEKPSIGARLFGLGSIFGKTLRDSRRAMLIVGGFITLILIVAGSAVATSFGTVETRAEGASLASTLPPIFLGLYGGPQPNVETLGGLVNWRYGLVFFLAPGVWSLLALSSTLAGEMRAGTLEMVSGLGTSRRRIALEKLAGHLTAMTVVMFVVGVVIWAVAQKFAVLPGDAVSLGAALGYVLLMGLAGLAAGAVAFALAPLVGRGAAAGIAAGWMVASWVVWGYRDSVPAFHALSTVSWYRWTAGHRPIAGTYDWIALMPLAAIIVICLALGLVAFERRDLGDIGAFPAPRLPRAIRGLQGVFGRVLAERSASIVAWGGGLALYAFAIAASGDSLRQSLVENPAVANMVKAVFPGFDLSAPGFGLQLAFLAFGYLGIAVAAGMLIGGWASDESEGRLDLVLAAPVARLAWFGRSAAAVFVAVLLVTAVVAAGIALGVAASGGRVAVPVAGTAVLALYGSAAAGVGLAVGGLFGPSSAGPAVYAAAVVTMFLDIIVPALKLPDWLREAALSSHFGEPMLGHWDLVGVTVSLGVAIAGLGLGAWGFSRRDLRG